MVGVVGAVVVVGIDGIRHRLSTCCLLPKFIAQLETKSYLPVHSSSLVAPRPRAATVLMSLWLEVRWVPRGSEQCVYVGSMYPHQCSAAAALQNGCPAL